MEKRGQKRSLSPPPSSLSDSHKQPRLLDDASTSSNEACSSSSSQVIFFIIFFFYFFFFFSLFLRPLRSRRGHPRRAHYRHQRFPSTSTLIVFGLWTCCGNEFITLLKRANLCGNQSIN